MYSSLYSAFSINVLVLVLIHHQCTRTHENVLGPRSGKDHIQNMFILLFNRKSKKNLCFIIYITKDYEKMGEISDLCHEIVTFNTKP